MAKKKPKTQQDEPSRETMPVSTDQDAALRESGMTLPEDDRVFRVEIPRCLLGEKFIKAKTGDEAIAKYKNSVGIKQHAEPARVKQMGFSVKQLPEGIELYGEDNGTDG